jgi:predicted ATPase
LLASYFQLSWTNKTRQGLFFRAEDFTGFVRSVNELRSAFDKDMQDFEASLEGHSLERVRGMITGQKNALIEKYGSDLNSYSHGEGFRISLHAKRHLYTGRTRGITFATPPAFFDFTY